MYSDRLGGFSRKRKTTQGSFPTVYLQTEVREKCSEESKQCRAGYSPTMHQVKQHLLSIYVVTSLLQLCQLGNVSKEQVVVVVKLQQ